MTVTRLLVATSVFASMLFVGSPSDAGGTGCQLGTLCLFQNESHDTLVKTIMGSRPRIVNLRGDANNSVSSFDNRLKGVVFLYTGRNANGERLCALPDAHPTSMPGFNDVVSSVKITRRDTCPT